LTAPRVSPIRIIFLLFWCMCSGNPCQYIRIKNTDGQWLAFSFLKVLDEQSLELDYFIA